MCHPAFELSCGNVCIHKVIILDAAEAQISSYRHLFQGRSYSLIILYAILFRNINGYERKIGLIDIKARLFIMDALPLEMNIIQCYNIPCRKSTAPMHSLDGSARTMRAKEVDSWLYQ